MSKQWVALYREAPNRGTSTGPATGPRPVVRLVGKRAIRHHLKFVLAREYGKGVDAAVRSAMDDLEKQGFVSGMGSVIISFLPVWVMVLED